MYPTITPGSKIRVNKTLFGGRIYKSFDFSEGAPLRSFRVKGIRDVRRNDIVVFNYPFNDNLNQIIFKINYVYTKRCIALPGDLISIVNGYYKVEGVDVPLGYIENQAALSSVKEGSYYYSDDNLLFREYEPIYVPAAGDILELDEDNYNAYRLLIEYETGKNLSLIEDKVYSGDDMVSEYKFLKNYYFMAGDNVLSSYDSRYFGPIPEEYIIGIVTKIKRKNDRWRKIE